MINNNDAMEDNITSTGKQRLFIYGYATFDVNDERIYKPWYEGYVLHIEKDGVVVKLEGLEAFELVKALPRTVGGSFL